MELNNVKLDPECYIAPNCTLLGDVKIERNASIYPGAVLRAERSALVVGENSNIQDNCVLHVDTDLPCTIGKDVTVGHGAIVHCATVKDRTIIGMGAIILDGAVIGEDCVIGAGTVIPLGTEIPDGSLVVGVPGKVKRSTTDDERAYNLVSANDYAEEARELADKGFFYKGANVPEDIPSIRLQPRYNYQCFR